MMGKMLWVEPGSSSPLGPLWVRSPHDWTLTAMYSAGVSRDPERPH